MNTWKNYLVLLLAAMLLVSCGKKEKTLPKNKIELTGDLYSSFEVSNDSRLFMTPSPTDKSKWMICATVPMQKISNKSVRNMYAAVNLLDGKGNKVNPGFMLMAEDMKSVATNLNANNYAEQIVVFSTPDGLKKDFSSKEAKKLIKKTKTLGLILSTTRINLPDSNPEYNGVTLEDLLQEYDIYEKLEQYDKDLRNGQKKKAKQLEDEIWEIEKQVKNDASLPRSVRDGFMNYIEKKEDQIEDKY